ncbi:hypothetical protein LGL55_14375 [Clostridium tagluense]|uniref:TolB family protein n=1 Tax=Clostridium tagluense TaxID=360422 RepID=UPI001CF577E2|nr:hypothetical protein [Clostridium tagluense]MCB2312479.1 hypothetical protein [Clostridium tagluense]MCB2317154.1 hypothetical protein [Clostridium tagluense]MCB2322018.1 hypothetical protein [Clostridium tagluense]MCB2327027.1 hypothetical protein [Clostridium tagluense]MCB2331745.1 hypothetical protein [Clostridium tagluense]
MGQGNKNWKVGAVVAGILVLGAVSVVYSYSKPLMASNNSVVVSANKLKAVAPDEYKPLQVVKSEKTDRIEGLNNMIGLVGDNQAIVQIGLSRKDVEEKIKKLDKENTNEEEELKFSKEVTGGTYKLNLSTFEKSPSNLEDRATISPDKTKYLYDTKEKGESCYYIVDIKSNSKKKINVKGNMLGQWSINSKYIVGLTFDKSPSIVVYDVENDKLKEFKEGNQRINLLAGIYSNNGKDVYFVGTTKTKNNGKIIITEGIYKLSTDDGKVQPVMILPSTELKTHKNRMVNHGFAVINEGQKIVFEGNINGEDGLFIYDVNSKKTKKFAQSIGSHIVPFWISPDENKIVYATYSGEDDKGVWSIYAAKFNGNEIVNKILLLKNINYFNMFRGKTVFWNNDSNKVTILESKILNLDSRIFAENGIIHSIYLK